MVKHLKTVYPAAPIVAMGLSTGAGIILRYAETYTARAPPPPARRTLFLGALAWICFSFHPEYS